MRHYNYELLMQNLGVKTYARKVQERREQEAQMGELDGLSNSHGQESHLI
jgi:hypothetical protein